MKTEVIWNYTPAIDEFKAGKDAKFGVLSEGEDSPVYSAVIDTTNAYIQQQIAEHVALESTAYAPIKWRMDLRDIDFGPPRPSLECVGHGTVHHAPDHTLDIEWLCQPTDGKVAEQLMADLRETLEKLLNETA